MVVIGGGSGVSSVQVFLVQLEERKMFQFSNLINPTRLCWWSGRLSSTHYGEKKKKKKWCSINISAFVLLSPVSTCSWRKRATS